VKVQVPKPTDRGGRARGRANISSKTDEVMLYPTENKKECLLLPKRGKD